MKAAVIGHPISHSLSPSLFEFLAENGKQPLEYFTEDIALEELPDKFSALKDKYLGLNVTLPLKEAVLKFASRISPEVKVIGAANVVHFKNHETIVYNTDVEGCLETWRQNKINLKGEGVFVIGSGGAARAVLYACGTCEASNVFIFGRNQNRAIELCHHFQAVFPKTAFHVVDSGSEPSAAFVVNATPLGMQGFDGDSTLFQRIFSTLKSARWAFDVVYRPEHTPFLQEAGKHRCLTVGGLSMLVYQALSTWRIWFPESPLSQDLGQVLTAEMRKRLF